MNTRPSPSESDSNNRDTWIEDRIPDPSLFFTWEAQDQLLQSVAQIMENTEDVILLIGPQGAGKTTLIYKIQSQAQDHWMLCRVDANPMLHTDQLLQRLARRIGLNSGVSAPKEESQQQGKQRNNRNQDTDYDNDSNLPIPLGEVALTDLLHSGFSNLRLQGRLPVVFVDDAEQLPPDTMQALIRLHARTIEGLSPFALILLAEPVLDSMLTSRQLQISNLSHFQRLEVPRITLDQIDKYIKHFLRTENIKTALNWPPQRLEELHTESNGLPGKISTLIRRALRGESGLNQKRNIGGKMLWVLAGLIAIVAAGFGLLQFPEYNEYLRQWISGITQKTSESDWVSQNLPLPQLNSNNSAIANNPNAASTATSTDDISQAPMIKPLPLPATAKDPEDASNIILSPSDDSAANDAAATSTAAANTIPIDSTLSATPNNTTTPTLKRNDWLQQQPATTHTLQLITAGSEDEAVNYITRNNIADQAFYIEVQHGDSTLYYVLYGTYPSRTAANAAIGKLPPKLRKKRPFPLSFKKAQSEMKK